MDEFYVWLKTQPEYVQYFSDPQKLEIGDLLKQRPGARNALFVYSGSVHMVLPLTEDPAIMELFLFSLSTDLMPVAGKTRQPL